MMLLPFLGYIIFTPFLAIFGTSLIGSIIAFGFAFITTAVVIGAVALIGLQVGRAIDAYNGRFFQEVAGFFTKLFDLFRKSEGREAQVEGVNRVGVLLGGVNLPPVGKRNEQSLVAGRNDLRFFQLASNSAHYQDNNNQQQEKQNAYNDVRSQ